MCSSLMDVSSEITDPAYWRRRAEEARRLAKQLSDPVARQTLEDIAANCDQLAEITAARRSAETRG
jgi:formylglycine-generating enzyme required for sulfatase activity